MHLSFACSIFFLSAAFNAEPSIPVDSAKYSITGSKQSEDSGRVTLAQKSENKSPTSQLKLVSGQFEEAVDEFHPSTIDSFHTISNENIFDSTHVLQDSQPANSISRFTAGFESVIVMPFFDNDVALGFDKIAGPPPYNVTTTEFQWELKHSPRIWLAYDADGGLGFQVRYWQFDHGESLRMIDTANDLIHLHIDFDSTSESFGIVTFDDGEEIQARQDIELHVIDTEATWLAVNSERSEVKITSGFRYVSFQDDYFIQTYLSPGGAPDERFQRNRDFQGFGPTVSLMGKRQIAHTKFALYINGRLSAVFGRSTLDAVDIDSFNELEDTFRQDTNDVISVTELQAGFEWLAESKLLSHSEWLFRIGVEGQLWNDLVRDDIDAFNTDGTLGFFGLQVAGGVTY